MTPLLSRLIAIALLVLLLGTVWTAWVLPAWTGFRDDAANIEELRDTTSRMDRLAASLAPLESELSLLEEQVSGQQLTLRAPSAALAAAELQERVKQIVSENGGIVASIQVLTPETEGGFERVGLMVQMSVSTGALLSILHGLESEKPYLILDDLDIRSQTRAAPRRKARGKPAVARIVDRLSVRFRVHGYRVQAPETSA